MTTMLIEFECRIACEAYPKPNETAVDVLERGDFQYHYPRLLRWRTYALDGDGNAYDFGEWHDVLRDVNLMRFFE